MSSTRFESRRRFQIWRYVVSHGQLLLRSTKPDRDATRIDILFKHVGFIQLATTLEGLAIREVSNEQPLYSEYNLSPAESGHRKIFEVISDNCRGHVFAGAVFWHEDKGDYYEASFFEASFIDIL